jgi:hypothetical protein
VPDGWIAAPLDALERVPLPEEGVDWLPVRAELGIGAFGVNAWTGDAGAELIGPHDETDDFAGGHEELYVVVSGSAVFTLDASEVDAPAGTLVFVRDRAVGRRAVAREDATLVLTVGSSEGAPFHVAPWEFLVRAGAASRRDDLDDAVATCRAGLDVCPGSPELLYHLACYESLAGRYVDARKHLSEAVSRDPRIELRAASDPDLEPLREHDVTISAEARRS